MSLLAGDQAQIGRGGGWEVWLQGESLQARVNSQQSSNCCVEVWNAGRWSIPFPAASAGQFHLSAVFVWTHGAASLPLAFFWGANVAELVQALAHSSCSLNCLYVVAFLMVILKLSVPPARKCRETELWMLEADFAESMFLLSAVMFLWCQCTELLKNAPYLATAKRCPTGLPLVSVIGVFIVNNFPKYFGSLHEDTAKRCWHAFPARSWLVLV